MILLDRARSVPGAQVDGVLDAVALVGVVSTDSCTESVSLSCTCYQSPPTVYLFVFCGLLHRWPSESFSGNFGACDGPIILAMMSAASDGDRVSIAAPTSIAT